MNYTFIQQVEEQIIASNAGNVSAAPPPHKLDNSQTMDEVFKQCVLCA